MEGCFATRKEDKFMQERVGMNVGAKTALMGVAVSKLAGVLGVGDIVQSEEYGYNQGGDAKKAGAFGEARKGTPLGEVAAQMEARGKYIKYSPKAAKQLTDLQILDYLCNNMGRKLDNILVEFDTTEDGATVNSIKGYDNSFSFGQGKADKTTDALAIQNFAQKVKPVAEQQEQEGNEEQQQAFFQTLFEAMDPEMAKRISEIKEEDLEIELGGLLERKQIEMAIKRLRNLKRLFTEDRQHNEKKYNPDDAAWREIGEKGYSFRTYLARTKPQAQQ